MLNKKDKDILKSLIKIPSPSGFERPIAGFIKDCLKQRGVKDNQLEIDKCNNLIVNLNYKKEKTVLIDAHSDEIGFIVSNVDRWGSISLQYIGGGCSTILSARHLNILSKQGIVPAVINRKHSHLVGDEDTELTYSPDQADVDIGLRDRKDVLKHIRIGDPVVYSHNFTEMLNDFYAGYGFDDKSGCFILMKAIEGIVKSKIKPSTNLIFVFSAQEETGNSKLLPVVRKMKPDLVIEADVTFATDYGNMDELEREAGKCELGKGMALYRGVDIDEKCWELAVETAKKNKIPYQIQTCAGRIGYTSLEMTGEGEGIKALVWGIPLRSMHAPTEVIHGDDLLSGAFLLSCFLQNKKLSKLL